MSSPGTSGILMRQEHLLDIAGECEVEVDPLLFHLQVEEIGVVHREPRLLGQRLDQRVVRLGERQAVRRVADAQHAGEALADHDGRGDDEAHPSGRRPRA